MSTAEKLSLYPGFNYFHQIPPLTLNVSEDLEFGHPCCVYNNEIKYNEGQNTTKFIS